MEMWRSGCKVSSKCVMGQSSQGPALGIVHSRPRRWSSNISPECTWGAVQQEMLDMESAGLWDLSGGP